MPNKNTRPPNKPSSCQILIADDDPVTLQKLRHHLETANHQVTMALDGMEAVQKMKGEIDVAIVDLEMPKKSGLECLDFIRSQFPDTSVLMISGKGEIADAVAAMKQGALEYITKPFDRDELLARVEHARWASKLSRDNRGLRELVTAPIPTSGFVAESDASKKLIAQLSRVATLDSTLLITGESGTGKTTVARMIHEAGVRNKGPFVAVNCASLPRDLVEAELFGHAKGSFTGAVNDRPGRAEIADGGTLFLDEIGDLPLELQPKFLTFLQDRTFQRIGSNKVFSVDVRIIAATHQDLAGLCRSKRFREDLYFRLNVISLHAPALRERRDDIDGLAAHILARIARQRKHETLQCDRATLDLLRQHDWRGNIRELENVLERASAFCEGQIIRTEDISIESGVFGDDKPNQPNQDVSSRFSGKTLSEIEKLAIIETLKASKGNKAEAARRLGISEKGMYNKMKRHGLNSKPE